MGSLTGKHTANVGIGKMLDTQCWMLDHAVESFFFIQHQETDIQYLSLLRNKVNRRN